MMAGETDSMRMLLQAISAVQRLRENVNEAFLNLHRGVKLTADETVDGKVKQFIAELPLYLCSINDNFR